MAVSNMDFQEIRITDGELNATLVNEDDYPNSVIKKGTVAKLNVDWKLTTSVPWILANTRWELKVFAESIGPGDEPLIGHKELEIGFGPLEWHEEILLDTTTPQDGPYKLVMVLMHQAQSAPGVWENTHMAGFVEIPMVQFYTPAM